MVQFILYICLLLSGATVIIGQTCQPNAVWQECGPGCKDYCTKDFFEICLEPCKSGCFCIDGYKFKGVDSTECIPAMECPICGINQEYRVCGTACPDYCGKPEGMGCSGLCEEGCFCKEGYVRETNQTLAFCIPEFFCP